LSSYWDRWQVRQASRRTLLKGAGFAGVGAAGMALVGCGDDDDDSGGSGGVQLATPTPSGAATATPSDPFAGAKRGGTYKIYTAGDAPSLDPYGNLSFLTKGFAAYHYSRLYKYKTGPGILPLSVRPEPDIVQTAESTPDGLKWTFKLRSDVKFHNTAPVNGRQLTTDDVKFSWSLLTAPTNANASQVKYVDKVEYPDKQTVVFTLKGPNAAFLDALADTNLLFIVPTESESQFDRAKTAIGSGPWMLDSYQPSVKIVRKRNPEWYNKNVVFFDSIEQSIIPEYANRLAQFLAGNLDGVDLNGDDLVTVKKQIPQAQLNSTVGATLSFLFFDPDPASPWKDPRVRQAVSMAINRDDLLELGYNLKKLKEAGLDVQGPWHNIIPAGETRWWIDPKGKDQGDSAKYFKYDPAEAKKLLAAAGFPDGFSTTYQYTANRYGKLFNDIAEAQINYLNQIGIKTTTDVQDYSSKYITQTFLGNFKGIAFGYETPFPEAGSYLTRFFTEDPNNHSKVKDATMTKLAQDQAIEANEEKRKAIFKEAQIKNAESMFYVPSVAGAGSGWTGSQPNIKGTEYRVKGYGQGTEEYVYRWKA